MASEAIKTNEDKDSSSSMEAQLESFVKEITVAYQSRHGVTVLNHELENQSMVELGCNVASGVVRLKLRFQKNKEKCQSSLVVKIPHFSPSYTFFKELKLYEKESYMYQTVLPRMHNLWQQESIFPTAYGTSHTGILALENLEEQGFGMRQKNSQFDLTECQIVLETLGKFHALSFKYLKIHGTEEFDSVMSPSGDPTSFNEILLPRRIEKIGKYVVPHLSQDQLNKWSEFLKNPTVALDTAYKSHNVGGIKVILHGDLQSKNLLWKKNECKLIDFQVSRRGSPALDLIFFLLTSVKFGVFQRHRQGVCEHYLAALNRVLEELDCAERYTLSELNEGFRKCKAYSIFILCIIIPISWSGVGPGNFSMESEAEERACKFEDIIKSDDYITFFKNWMDLD